VQMPAVPGPCAPATSSPRAAVWESAVADGAPSPDLRCPFEMIVTRPANASGVRTGFGRESACCDLARLNQ
jgi:hypothetical protein